MEFEVKDLVEGWTGQASTLAQVGNMVEEIKAYAEQEGHDPEVAVWVKVTPDVQNALRAWGVE